MNLYDRLIKGYKKIQLGLSPQMNVVWGFFLYTASGFLLLSIPLFHKTDISLLDNLFTATSAVSTTGLVTLSVVDSYNFFGQLIILLLFQAGGLGYMTLTTYYLIFTRHRITNWHSKLLGTEFTLPETIKITDFIKSVVVFTLVMESLGSIALFFAFQKSGLQGFELVWYSIFHSVSAFCTSGFALFTDSFEAFRSDNWVTIIISCLAISGALGFIVVTDLWYRLTRKTKEISFSTKSIAIGFFSLLSIGTLLMLWSEPQVFENEEGKLLTAFFQSMTSMTTVGFNTIEISELSLPILLFVIFLMYIGASPSGTAGGMKITTLIVMFSVLKSRLLGQKRISFFNRAIPFERLYVATSTFMLYTTLIFVFSFLLAYTENFPFDRILFEVASALGTVGLSTGITHALSPQGKVLMIILMFIGRVGVLTFGFALLHRSDKADEEKHAVIDDIVV